MLRTIHLHGALAEQFQAEYRLAVEMPLEAFRALIVQVPHFETELRKGHFFFVRGDYDSGVVCDEDLLKVNLGSVHDFHLIPAAEGAKRGLGKSIAGAVLFTAGLVLGNGPLLAVGALLFLGGASQLLTKVPRRTASTEGQDDKPGYLFNGAINTNEPGGVIPLVFGRLDAGSVIVSAGISSERLEAAVPTSAGPPVSGNIGYTTDIV